MGAPYQRQDVANNIANGNIINADDIDSEFNTLETAFAAVTGHSHDGTTGEGGPITFVGPAQDLNVSGTQVLPKTDNTLDLGSTTFEFKDLWIDGTANIDSLVADTADINAGTIDATVIGATTPAAGTFSTLGATTGNLTTGVFGLGAVATPSVTFTGDTNTGLWSPSADILAASTAGTERLRIDASGNIAIGTNISAVAGYTNFALGNAVDGGNIRLRNGTTTVANFSNTATTAFLGTVTTAQMRFGVQGNTQMNIDGTTGNVAIGNSNTSANAVALLDLTSTTKGALLPRMNTTERNAIATVPTGLLIFNTTAGRLEFYTGSAWTAVGAGTTTLTDLGVTVAGQALLDDADATAQRATLGLGTMATQNANAVAITGGSATLGSLTVDTNVLHVDATNNRVGVGTTTPQVPLEVVGSVRAGSQTIAADYSLSIGSGTTNVTNFARYSGLDGIGEIRHQGVGTFQTVLEGAANYIINTNGVERFRIEPTGGAFRINSNYGTTGQVLTSQGSTTAPAWVTPENPIKAWVNFNGVPLSGTYSRTGTLVTVTLTAHGMTTGMIANLDFTTGTATDGSYVVTVVDANTFTVVDTVSGATSGNVTRNLFIRASLNVSSITDNGTGDYTVNFTSALADAFYSVQVTANHPNNTNFSSTAGLYADAGGNVTKTTTALRVGTGSSNTTGATDRSEISVTVVR